MTMNRLSSKWFGSCTHQWNRVPALKRSLKELRREFSSQKRIRKRDLLRKCHQENLIIQWQIWVTMTMNTDYWWSTITSNLIPKVPIRLGRPARLFFAIFLAILVHRAYGPKKSVNFSLDWVIYTVHRPYAPKSPKKVAKNKRAGL